MVEFQHVHVANGNRTLKLLPGTAIKQGNLTRSWQIGQLQQLFDFAFFCTIEYWRCDWHTFFQVLCQTQYFVIREGRQINFLTHISAQIVSALDKVT